ncbi:MAG: hypothetical protein SFW66_01350 [Gammaproteobacteria bacterium]|nr:hypothetical protein [Gammaproteobacteria bacterium]
MIFEQAFNEVMQIYIDDYLKRMHGKEYLKNAPVTKLSHEISDYEKNEFMIVKPAKYISAEIVLNNTKHFLIKTKDKAIEAASKVRQHGENLIHQYYGAWTNDEKIDHCHNIKTKLRRLVKEEIDWLDLVIELGELADSGKETPYYCDEFSELLHAIRSAILARVYANPSEKSRLDRFIKATQDEMKTLIQYSQKPLIDCDRKGCELRIIACVRKLAWVGGINEVEKLTFRKIYPENIYKHPIRKTQNNCKALRTDVPLIFQTEYYLFYQTQNNLNFTIEEVEDKESGFDNKDFIQITYLNLPSYADACESDADEDEASVQKSSPVINSLKQHGHFQQNPQDVDEVNLEINDQNLEFSPKV